VFAEGAGRGAHAAASDRYPADVIWMRLPQVSSSTAVVAGPIVNEPLGVLLAIEPWNYPL
jgi:acyl-CoA reductase-like NAD-dependent aldehyde dehydrogenase